MARSPEEPERLLVRRLVAVEEDHVAVAGATPGSKAQVERIPKASKAGQQLGQHRCVPCYGAQAPLQLPATTMFRCALPAGTLLVRGRRRRARSGRRLSPQLGPRAAGAH